MLFWQNYLSPHTHTENNLPNIRELSDFNDIFRVYLSMNDLYNALFILFQNFLIFFSSLNFDTPTLGV